MADTQQVEIKVWRDEVLLIEETVQPTFDEFYPNSEECDQTPCLSTTIEANLS